MICSANFVRRVAAIGLLIGISIGIAQAAPVAATASAGSARFIPANPSDAPFISHPNGRSVTNTDTAFHRYVVADLGVITATSSFIIRISAFHENANTGTLTCWAVANDVIGVSGIDFAPAFNWTAFGQSTSFGIIQGLSSTAHYQVSVVCAIPPRAGPEGSKVFGAWTE